MTRTPGKGLGRTAGMGGDKVIHFVVLALTLEAHKTPSAGGKGIRSRGGWGVREGEENKGIRSPMRTRALCIARSLEVRGGLPGD